jgi:hypothetical protein
MPRYFLPNVRFAPAADIVAKVAFFGDERKFPEPLMRFARGDVRTVSFHPKSITDLRGGGTFAVRQSQLIRKQKATRALRRMAFARPHPWALQRFCLGAHSVRVEVPVQGVMELPAVQANEHAPTDPPGSNSVFSNLQG